MAGAVGGSRGTVGGSRGGKGQKGRKVLFLSLGLYIILAHPKLCTFFTEF